ncbi:hypothetical protein [Streptomyces sp. NBC_00847]|uniref:hypothetical protein n=1 Tax=Streptomyces sp. NBC_00847 TaxID=2975850 RepID=UPI00225DE97B|nr:hypothetical protein [Streptomyces sp. NBC_00847]MCX4886068.1 hypothetical protein [Streptomyces sp. NBC_00847]
MSRREPLVLPSARSTKPEAGQQEALLDLPATAPNTTRRQSGGVVGGLVGADLSGTVSVSSLPTPYDVAPEVVSPLNDKERADLELCEQALHGFRKALVVAGKALEVINRGRLYRETHATFADYVLEVWGFKRSQAYRLIEEWPVAVAVSPIGDINEAQARELLPVFKDHGREATAVLYRAARELTGGKVTAAALAEARGVLPHRLSAPEQAADVLRVAAAEGRVPLIVPPRVQVPEQPAGEPVRTAEDIAREDARAGAEGIAVLEAALAQQQQIYDRLAGVVPAALLYDPGRAEMLLGQLRQYANRTAYRARGRSVDDSREAE